MHLQVLFITNWDVFVCLQYSREPVVFVCHTYIAGETILLINRLYVKTLCCALVHSKGCIHAVEEQLIVICKHVYRC